MKLLVDVGNSRIKWCSDKNGTIKTGSPIEYKQTDFLQAITQQWLAIDKPRLLAISSVSAIQTSQQIIDFAKKLWPDIKVVIAKPLDYGFSVTNAYQQSENLGVDRWLGLIALHNYYPGNSCIVDCGTAITIDCLNVHGLHLGGLISPGLLLMKQSLQQGTEDLPFSNKRYTTGLANYTEAAIYTGTLYAAVGLIEKVIKNLCSCQTVVMTGGDAELLANHMDLKTIIKPDFVLEGLSLFCKGE